MVIYETRRLKLSQQFSPHSGMAAICRSVNPQRRFENSADVRCSKLCCRPTVHNSADLMTFWQNEKNVFNMVDAILLAEPVYREPVHFLLAPLDQNWLRFTQKVKQLRCFYLALHHTPMPWIIFTFFTRKGILAIKYWFSVGVCWLVDF